LDFLNASLRDVPERHSSIRVVFDQSWKMLSEDEQSVMCKLSVFRGGFDLEATQAVAGASLRLIASLVEKSLVRGKTEHRYDLHELIRQYAAQKLLEAGETEQTRQRQLDYFLVLVQRAEPELYRSNQLAWFARFDNELDNIRAVLNWSLTSDTQSGLS